MLTRKLNIEASLILLIISLDSCVFSVPVTGPDRYDRVFVCYLSGYNNLSDDLIYNLNQLVSGSLPAQISENAVVALVHNTASLGDYDTRTSPYLIHLYSRGNTCVRDTIVTYPAGTNVSTPEMVTRVLLDVQSNFPADHYCMLFSSHGTGYLPSGYYGSSSVLSRGYIPDSSEELLEQVYGSTGPLVKSFGSHYDHSWHDNSDMEISEFADALPFHLDFILFDACLMGGVEDAYELRDKCDYLIASPTEVMAAGFYYPTMLERIFSGGDYDLEGICRDYYDFYYKIYESYTSASREPVVGSTVSLIDCRQLDGLAEAMRGIFSNHRSTLCDAADSAQEYFRDYTNVDYFYDLRDFAVCAGAADEELAVLDAALDKCVVCHMETPEFLEIELDSCCGLSCYIPDPDNTYLNAYYKTLDWNKATGLVE